MNTGLPSDLNQIYMSWLNMHPDRFIDSEDFASAYRWGVNYAIRSTSFLSPQFEALRKLVKLIEADTSHDECLQVIAKLQRQIDEYRQQLVELA